MEPTAAPLVVRTMRCLLLLPLALAACSGEEPAPAPVTNIADNGVPVAPTPTPTPRPRPDATGPGTALGLTRLQIEDADLLDAAGGEMGEVERVETDPGGAIRALVIELGEGANAGRMVRVGLDGLAIVPDGDDWNLQTTRVTRDQLAAMPAVTN